MAKMTREQAIELLKNRMVKVIPELSMRVQDKLFRLGFKWNSGDEIVMNTEKPYILIKDNMRIECISGKCSLFKSTFTEITPKEILSIEIVEDYVPKFGDIVRVNTDIVGFERDYMISIMPDKQIPCSSTMNFFDIANIYIDGKLHFRHGYSKCFRIVPASESEKQELFDKLAKAGKRWNAEKKCLEDIQYELNLCEILKDCPEGTKLYSTIHGEVEFKCIYSSQEYPVTYSFSSKDGEIDDYGVSKEGLVYSNCNGECTLFPSKDQRDWSKWVCPKPDLAVDTPVMVSNDYHRWKLNYYAEKKLVWADSYKSKDGVGTTNWPHIIPFDKFNPNDIEESLKYDICR